MNRASQLLKRKKKNIKTIGKLLSNRTDAIIDWTVGLLIDWGAASNE
jgi:hypothetical protein